MSLQGANLLVPLGIAAVDVGPSGVSRAWVEVSNDVEQARGVRDHEACRVVTG